MDGSCYCPGRVPRPNSDAAVASSQEEPVLEHPGEQSDWIRLTGRAHNRSRRTRLRNTSFIHMIMNLDNAVACIRAGPTT